MNDESVLEQVDAMRIKDNPRWFGVPKLHELVQDFSSQRFSIVITRLSGFLGKIISLSCPTLGL